MSDEKLEQLVTEYADLAKDKKVDAAALLINALEQQDANTISSKTKRWAYLISLSVPPIGLLFAAYFYFDERSDAKQAAMVCVLLTVLSIVFGIIMLKLVFSGAGVSTQQLQQIKPADVYELAQ